MREQEERREGGKKQKKHKKTGENYLEPFLHPMALITSKQFKHGHPPRTIARLTLETSHTRPSTARNDPTHLESSLRRV